MTRPSVVAKSAASNLIPLPTTGPGSKLTAPPFLSKSEASLFSQTAIANPHLTSSDVPLLACYVQGLVKGQKLVKQADVAAWEKCMRVVLSMATKLKLTPQALHPDTVARRKRDAPKGPTPWRGDDEEETS